MKNLLMKVILFAVVIAMITSLGIVVSAYEYPDEGYWANEAIDAAIDNGLLLGKDDGKMHSEDNLTRAEMAAIMVRSFGAEIKADISKYTDLNPSAWYFNDFSKAVQMRVFEGDGTGHMRPNDYITREEVFTVVARALVLNTDDYSALNKFNDKSNISSWARGYMSILAEKSYVNGDNLGNANPKKNITRAEFAQLMYNIFRNYYSKSGTYTSNNNSNSVMINVGDVTFKNVTIDGDLVIGDGNGKGTIRLENVNIKGRLLVRGSQRVELVKTTVGEMVVVNNYNTVVHFDNYRNEKVFDNIILNTQATFKKTGGGSSSGATYYTVTFYKKGNEIGNVAVKKGGTIKESQIPSGNINYEGYVKDSEVSSIYSEKYTHIIDYGWWYNNEDTGKWEEFTTATVVTGDMDVHLKSPKFTAKITLADGMAFDFYTFYDPETRFADSVKDIIYKRGLLTALKTSGYYDKIREKGIVQKVLDTDDNIMMLSYMVRFSQILGEENVEKFIVDGAKESFGNNTELEKSFVEYLEDSVDSSDADYVAETKGLMVNAFEHVIDDDPTLVDELEALAHSIMEDPDAFNDITDYDYNSFTDEQREAIIDEFVLKLETPSTERDIIVAKLVDYLFTPAHEHELEDMVHYAMVFLNDHTDERDQVVDNIIEKLYKEDLDKLVAQLINNDQFEINERIMFVAEGMKNTLLRDYNYESFFGSKVPEKLEKVFEIYPEEKIKEIYNFALDDLIYQIDEAIDIAKAGGTGKIDCGITPVVNIISDLYIPLHEGFTKILDDKASDKYYYSENIYLQELVKLLDPQVWVSGSANTKPNDKTGYKIYDLDYYYDLMYKIIVLSDDAILWYHENLSEEKYIEVTNNYQELVLKYANIFADIASDYAEDGTVPGENDKLTAVEKALREKYPEFVEGLLDAFKDSDFYNKELGEADYEKIRDKVYAMFENVNLTTDEYFDKVLNHEAMEDIEDKLEDKLDGKLDGEYYTKIDDDTYEFEVNDYIIRFFRELIG